MTEEEFYQHLDKCNLELEEKQKAFLAELEKLGLKEKSYDQENRKIQFKKDGKVAKEYPVVFIGTWAHTNQLWMWSWSNKQMNKAVRDEAKKLKQLSKVTGITKLRHEMIEADEELAYDFVALSVHHLNARGIYRSPGEMSDLFLAIL